MKYLKLSCMLAAIVMVLLAASCARATPAVVEKEVVVEKRVVETVVVEKEVVVEKPVVETVVVEKEKIVAAKPIKIGFVSDFSGMWATNEVPTRDGARFAVDEINAAGGVLGQPLVLIVRDGQDDPALTVRLIEELIREGVVYIIGTVGDCIVSTCHVACEADIPISTGIGSAPTLVEDGGECCFTVIFNDPVQASVAAKYAYDQGYRTAFMMRSHEFPYVEDLPTYFQESFEHYGGEVIGEDEFRSEAGDYSAIVTTIAGLPELPDVIYTPMICPDSNVFMRQLRAAGMETPVIGPDTDDNPVLLDAGQAVEGFVFTTSGFPVEGTPLGDFYDRYEAVTGKRPDCIFYALGYDEIYAVKQAIETAGSAEPGAIMEAFANLKDFKGITGTWSMDPETRRAEKGITIVKVENNTFTYVDQFYPEFVPEP